MKKTAVLFLFLSFLIVSCGEDDNSAQGKASDTGKKFVTEINNLSSEFVKTRSVERKYYDSGEYGPLSFILNVHNRYLFLLGRNLSEVDNLIDLYHINKYVDNNYFNRKDDLFRYLSNMQQVYLSIDMFLRFYTELYDDYNFDVKSFAKYHDKAIAIADSLTSQASLNYNRITKSYQLKKDIYQKAAEIFGHLLSLKDHYYIKNDIIYFDNSSYKTKYEELEKQMNSYIDQLKSFE